MAVLSHPRPAPDVVPRQPELRIRRLQPRAIVTSDSPSPPARSLMHERFEGASTAPRPASAFSTRPATSKRHRSARTRLYLDYWRRLRRLGHRRPGRDEHRFGRQVNRSPALSEKSCKSRFSGGDGNRTEHAPLVPRDRRAWQSSDAYSKRKRFRLSE